MGLEPKGLGTLMKPLTGGPEYASVLNGIWIKISFFPRQDWAPNGQCFVSPFKVK